MSTLKTLLELYRESSNMEEDETMEIDEVNEEEYEEYRKFLRKKKTIEKPERGVVFELIPSLDAQEMKFVILNVGEDFTTIMPLSKWYEFATHRDVIVKIDGEYYIVQTDLPIDMPTYQFHTYFSGTLFEITKLDEKTMEKIEKVYKGTLKGDGKLLTPEKEEFKKFEAERYLPLWLGVINQSEELAHLNEELVNLKRELLEEALLKAHERKPIHGKGKNLEFFYDTKREILSIFPEEEFTGKEGRIVLETRKKKITLYEGLIRKEIKIPLKSEAYDYELFTRGLKLELI
ncbi:MAG TPA: hypothetical protein EYG91_03865 [Aquifex aeolicus]|nr:hypothetical protein [Aquifex aeolicus]